MKKLVLFICVVLIATSCTVSYSGTGYGRINKSCPTMNLNSFFYEQGTGKPFLPRTVFKRR